MPKLSQTIYNAKIVCRKINQNEKKMFVFFVSVWAGSVFFILLYLLTFAGVKLAFPGSLADITIMELGRGILAEFTTVSNWGCLGRDRSK